MKRRSFLATVGLSLVAGGLSAAARAQPRGTTFLVAHGAWSAGWCWKKMHPLMAAAGHRLITPTYTGIGEREHLANPSITLDTHIDDMLGVIKFEQLDRFVLIAHSYGGMVATGVADRVADRISKLVYLDAFVPTDGQALLDLLPPGGAERMREKARAADGWRVPPNPIPADTSAEDAKWIQQLRMPQPLKRSKLQCGFATARPASRALTSTRSARRRKTRSSRLPREQSASAGPIARSMPATLRT